MPRTLLDLCRAAVVDVVHDMDRMHEPIERSGRSHPHP